MRKGSHSADARRFLAQNLKVGRAQRGWTQEQLAEKAGLDRTQIGAIERQVSGASIDSLGALAHALGVAIHVLLMAPTEAQPEMLAAAEEARLKAVVGKALPREKKKHL